MAGFLAEFWPASWGGILGSLFEQNFGQNWVRIWPELLMRVFGGGGGWRWQLVARQSHFAPSKSCRFSSPLDFRNCVQQALDPWIKFLAKAFNFLGREPYFFGQKSFIFLAGGRKGYATVTVTKTKRSTTRLRRGPG